MSTIGFPVGGSGVLTTKLAGLHPVTYSMGETRFGTSSLLKIVQYKNAWLIHKPHNYSQCVCIGDLKFKSKQKIFIKKRALRTFFKLNKTETINNHLLV